MNAASTMICGGHSMSKSTLYSSQTSSVQNNVLWNRFATPQKQELFQGRLVGQAYRLPALPQNRFSFFKTTIRLTSSKDQTRSPCVENGALRLEMFYNRRVHEQSVQSWTANVQKQSVDELVAWTKDVFAGNLQPKRVDFITSTLSASLAVCSEDDSKISEGHFRWPFKK